jgi:hypothetical protein
MLNEYERTSIKHCLINFYYDENYEISHSYNLIDIDVLEITDKYELETLLKLMYYEKMRDDEDTSFSRGSVKYLTIGMPIYLDIEKEKTCWKKDGNTKLIKFVKELMKKYQINIHKEAFDAFCFDISFPEWYYKQL